MPDASYITYTPVIETVVIHRPELGAEIAEVKAELKTDFAAVKADILKRTAAAIGSAIGFQTAATVGSLGNDT